MSAPGGLKLTKYKFPVAPARQAYVSKKKKMLFASLLQLQSSITVSDEHIPLYVSNHF